MVYWEGDLDLLDEATIMFKVLVDSPLEDGTWITNTALIQYAGQYGQARYERQADTEIMSAPRLTSSTKEWESDGVGYGGILTYTITLVNDGTQNATVGLHDPIPAGTEYVVDSLSASDGYGVDYVAGPPPAIVGNGPVDAGESVTVTFAVQILITETGTITNTALINDNVNPRFSITTTTHVAAVSLEEPEEDVYCGDELVIPVRVENAYDLQGFEILVEYDTNALTGELIEEGTWFTPPAAWSIKHWDHEAGVATVAATLLNKDMGMVGDGDLYYLHFRTIGGGPTTLTITWSLLSDTPMPSFQPIPHNRISPIEVLVQPRTVSGVIEMQGRNAHHHDGVTLLLNGVDYGHTTDADGNYEFCPPVGTGEMFVLTAVKDGYLYGEKTITVDFDDNKDLTYLMLLGGDPIGEQETVTTESPCDPTKTVTVPGPPDDKVNILDLTFVGGKFNKQGGEPPDADWGPDDCEPEYLAYRADINEDNIVNIFDLVLVGNNFGKDAPSLWP
jgi:uncharacterized repeat protein (TIGR01451 family)